MSKLSDRSKKFLVSALTARTDERGRCFAEEVGQSDGFSAEEACDIARALAQKTDEGVYLDIVKDQTSSAIGAAVTVPNPRGLPIILTNMGREAARQSLADSGKSRRSALWQALDWIWKAVVTGLIAWLVKRTTEGGATPKQPPSSRPEA